MYIYVYIYIYICYFSPWSAHPQATARLHACTGWRVKTSKAVIVIWQRREHPTGTRRQCWASRRRWWRSAATNCSVCHYMYIYIYISNAPSLHLRFDGMTKAQCSTPIGQRCVNTNVCEQTRNHIHTGTIGRSVLTLLHGCKTALERCRCAH